MSKQAKVVGTKEFKRLITAANLTRHALRNRTMIYMSYYAGMRACEIAALRMRDIVGNNGEVLEVVVLGAEQTKGQSRCRVFINKKLRKYLADYLSAHDNVSSGSDDPLFYSQKDKGFSSQTIINLFAQLYKMALISGASSHSGRRTFLTNLSNQGVSPRIIQKLARHSSLNTTMLYLETNDTQLSNAAELARV